ncbi:AAA family ATPase [Magnetococcales bacterium HHB-1]
MFRNMRKGVVVLVSFSVENYKAFAREQNIQIRPVTLFFGWNSAGKSALIRFLPLIAESVKIDGPPIWLGGKAGRQSVWSDLVCKATQRDFLKFTLDWNDIGGLDSPLSGSWKVSGDLAGRWQYINEMSIEFDGKSMGVDYSLLRGEGQQGLVPYLEPALPGDRNFFDPLRREMKRLPTQVQWLSGVSTQPPRIVTYSGPPPLIISPDGRDAIDHLITAQLNSQSDPLLEVIHEFFRAFGEQFSLEELSHGAWRIFLQPQGQSHKVNLCDTGEGYAQVFPVLVALARACTGGPRLLCLEQPELHLHTRAQVELAKLLVKTAKATDDSSMKPSILVETHSEVLLTSVQLAIAKGDISPDMVRVYWVESNSDGTSQVTPIDFDEQGQPNQADLMWAFDEAVDLGRELVERQLAEVRL